MPCSLTPTPTEAASTILMLSQGRTRHAGIHSTLSHASRACAMLAYITCSLTPTEAANAMLTYITCSLTPTEAANPVLARRLLSALDSLPKPVLVQCASGNSPNYANNADNANTPRQCWFSVVSLVDKRANM